MLALLPQFSKKQVGVWLSKAPPRSKSQDPCNSLALICGSCSLSPGHLSERKAWWGISWGWGRQELADGRVSWDQLDKERPENPGNRLCVRQQYLL